jgi:hypothetical protein
MADEKRIRLAAKLYDARDAARSIYGETFATKITEFQGFVRAGMTKWKCGELESAMKLVAGLQRTHPFDSAGTQMLVLAACVEMIEPSVPDRSVSCPVA